MRYGAWVLAAALSMGCAADSTRLLNATPAPEDSSGTTSTAPAPSGTFGQSTQASVRVELRGLEALEFPDGACIRIERFVVRFAGVSLLRDLADPAASRVEVRGNPVIITPGVAPVVGRDNFDLNPGEGSFNGVRIELGPSRTGSAPADDADNTIFVRGVYTAPNRAAAKADNGSISPNPAPIMPGSSMGRSQQGATARTTVPFTFTSRRSEGLLVGFDSVAGAHDVVLVFPTNRWFGDLLQNYFRNEATTRARLGISAEHVVRLVGQGLLAADSSTTNVGEVLEEAILDSIGVEVR